MINFLKGLFGIWTTLMALGAIYGIVTQPVAELPLRLGFQALAWVIPVALVGGLVWLVRAGKRAAERSRRLIPCRMCGHQIAGNAMTCPSCGTETPTKSVAAYKIVMIAVWSFLGFTILYTISGFFERLGDAFSGLAQSL